MLRTRILSALIALPIVISLTQFPGHEISGHAIPEWCFWILAGTASAICSWEFAGMAYQRPEEQRQRLLSFLGHCAALLAMLMTQDPIGVLAAGMLVAFIGHVISPGPIEDVAHHISFAVLGLLWVPTLFFFLTKVHALLPHGREWVYCAYITAWAGDTGGYFAGRAFGRHKLAEAISPKKTVEGSIGGVITTTAGLFIARATFFPTLRPIDCILIGVCGGYLGQVGDLSESLVKRSVNVKDSGGIMPGHGGLLDRVDALLFIAPFMFYYALHISMAGR